MKYNELKLSIYESAYIEEKKSTADYRLSKFKKEHEYDSKDSTINMNGQRMKFKYLGGSNKHSKPLKGSISRTDEDGNRTIKMNRSSFNTKNPKTHEYIANHEMGHKVVSDHRWNDWEKDVDMDNAVDKSCKKLKININNGFSHGKNKDEYLADYYAINHTKNGEKVMKDTLNSLNKSLKKITDKDIPEKKKRELYEKGVSKTDISKKLKITKQFVKNESNNRRKIVNDLKNNKDIDFLKD